MKDKDPRRDRNMRIIRAWYVRESHDVSLLALVVAFS